MRFLGLVFALVLAASQAQAEEPATALLELTFTPTDRAQIAAWVELADGTFVATLGLTYAVASAGIGNRPGALQMNSGYRWPYGRREGALPVWAHRRAAAPNAKAFRRVIFQNRTSEGAASRTSSDQSVDDYYCLSFDRDSTGREALDAVTCASVFSSDKGRFITRGDVRRGYAEPFETSPGAGTMRGLGLTSLYPPRRNAKRCGSGTCFDHADVASFRSHAAEVMPELDAISRATPAGDRSTRWLAAASPSWDPAADYVLFVEVGVEGDYNDQFNGATLPTPKGPTGRWDSWAQSYGYAYRGQPSVVYSLPFRIDGASVSDTADPIGFGAIHGEDGLVRPMAETITDDPREQPGSGADRLRLVRGVRAALRVSLGDPCRLREPPVECGRPCLPTLDRCGDLVCGTNGKCQSMCVATNPPPQVENLTVSRHPVRNRAHMWARLAFTIPESDRPIRSFEVRVRPKGGSWDLAYTHDAVQELLPVALDVCADPQDPTGNRCETLAAGHRFSDIDLSGLQQQTEYEISVGARDGTCNVLGMLAYARFTTPPREFTTVSPCFVATAAYGSPLASEILVLRTFRDRYLATHRLGRGLIDVYYGIGPELADTVRNHSWLRRITQVALGPIVALARWFLS